MATTPIRGRPFQKGVSGNAAGRKPGSKTSVAALVDRLLEADVTKVTRMMLALAKGGDMRAIEAVLSRVSPVPRDRRIVIDLPPCDTAEGVAAAQTALVAQVAAGQLRASEASAVADLIELRRRSLETAELAARIDDLEARFQKGRP